jgi:hypothetical protein
LAHYIAINEKNKSMLWISIPVENESLMFDEDLLWRAFCLAFSAQKNESLEEDGMYERLQDI